MKVEVSMIGSRGIPGHRGGVERVLEAVTPRLTKRFHTRVHCASWSSYREPEWEGVQLIRTAGIRHKYFDTFSRALWATIKESLRPGRSLIHYHGSGSATLSWLPRLFGKKTVVTVHGLDWRRSKWNITGEWFLRFGEWAACRFPHRTIVVSKVLKQYLDKRYGINAVYIPNGVEERSYRAPEKISSWGLEARNYILFLARLVPEKGCHVLLDAFLSLKKTKNMKLVIVGPSWYSKEYVEGLKKKAASRQDIIFTGEVDDETLEELYSNCYIYCLPSEVEGMSLSLLDGMAFGSCIVTSDIPANADAIADAGKVFKTGDKDDLARQLNYLLERPREAENLRRKAKVRMSREFHWDRVAEQWEMCYEELLDLPASKVLKPWGAYQTLILEKGFQVKRIEVNAGARFSYQKHTRRSEKWTVVRGSGKVILEGKEHPVTAGSFVEIPVGTAHRMWNTSSGPLVFIEVQTGDYLGEDDIIRIEDDYQRASPVFSQEEAQYA